uniref:Arthropod-like defensin 2 n=1 Tax=Mytilus coruscus TaxID=42192 RepID=A0A8F6XY13_MYTCO|nr:arthropod-like defensin 2 [Mytilus coruscus]
MKANVFFIGLLIVLLFQHAKVISGSNGCPYDQNECNAYCHNIGCHRGGYCGGMMILKITCTCLRPCS